MHLTRYTATVMKKIDTSVTPIGLKSSIGVLLLIASGALLADDAPKTLYPQYPSEIGQPSSRLSPTATTTTRATS